MSDEQSNKIEPALNNTKKSVDPQVLAALITAIASMLVAVVAGIFALSTRPADAVKESKVATAELEAKIAIIRDSAKFPFVPPGTIMPYGGNDIDRLKEFGWLLCDGRDYPTNDYPILFQAIAYAWGKGDNTESHFRVPDLQGYFLRGVDPNGRTDLGITNRFALYAGGNISNRVGSYQPDAVGKHQHDTYMKPYGGRDLIWSDPQSVKVAAPISAFPQDWSKGLPTGFQGENETRPKNAYVYYIIKY